MNKRPLSVTVIGCFFLGAGVVALAYHGSEIWARRPFDSASLWILPIQVVAIVAALYLFRAANWARWLLLAWIAAHVILSAFHSPRQFVIHGLLFAVIGCCLLRRSAAAYFRGAAPGSA